MTSPTSQRTDFTLDVVGRYICNGLDEARNSTSKSVDSEARPFDIIVVGGGSFGSVLASHIFALDQTRSHRILVLEAGPFLYPEHVQNLPGPGLDTGEVWGTPWNSDSPMSWNQHFPGLAFCLGGRSLFWGGWSPYLLESEVFSPPWPASVHRDLLTNVLNDDGRHISYLDQAAEQIGTSATNDFIHGPLHEELRKVLFAGLKARVSTGQLTLAGNRGTLKKHEDLEAPLAVQSSGPRPGFFPFNKFNGVQLLIRAARLAQSEAEAAVAGTASTDQKNARKRLMVVPNTHLIRLERDGDRVVRVVTNRGTVDVPPHGKVFLALGTIENTRVALNSLPNAHGLIGRNLMAHLRSNLTFRVPRANFDSALKKIPDLQVSALFVKGIYVHDDGTKGHFHIQITASGAQQMGMDSEAQLWKKIPNIDELERFEDLTEDYVVVTLRGIGEMIGEKTPDPLNRITIDNLNHSTINEFDYHERKALVRLEAGHPDSKNMKLWDSMDAATEEIAKMFANGGPIQYLTTQGPSSGATWQSTPPSLSARRDTLSSTHHEGGTLWMGEEEGTSVTDDLGRFHECQNLFALGPCLLPTMGSPNPMLTGVALSRRTGDRLVGTPDINSLEPTYEWLFDGTQATFSKWMMAGGGAFSLVNGMIVTSPDANGNLGLLYHPRQFGDFNLRLEFLLTNPLANNSGIFVRFRNPRMAVPDRNNPNLKFPYQNQHWVAVDTGFEIQIDETAAPDGADMHRTGAVYGIPTDSMYPQFQKFKRTPLLRAGAWNEIEIEVVKNTYRVRLNGTQITEFTNADPYRGRSLSDDANSGFIGLQNHTGKICFRNIRVSTKAPRSFLDRDAVKTTELVRV